MNKQKKQKNQFYMLGLLDYYYLTEQEALKKVKSLFDEKAIELIPIKIIHSEEVINFEFVPFHEVNHIYE